MNERPKGRLSFFRLSKTIETEVEQAMAVSPGGAFVLSASEKWTALRSMHENFGVPLEVLRPFGICSDEHFRKVTCDWRFGSTSQTMLLRVSGAVERQLTAFQISTENGCDEGQIRMLSLLAKTLETIAVVEKRLADTDTQKDKKTSAGDPELDEKRAIAAHLEAELAALVEANS